MIFSCTFVYKWTWRVKQLWSIFSFRWLKYLHHIRYQSTRLIETNTTTYTVWEALTVFCNKVLGKTYSPLHKSCEVLVSGVRLLPYTSKGTFQSGSKFGSLLKRKMMILIGKQSCVIFSIIFSFSQICVIIFWWRFWRILLKFRKCWEVSRKIPSWFDNLPTVIKAWYQNWNNNNMWIVGDNTNSKHTTNGSHN